MRVHLYSGSLNIVEKSGVGRAIHHQKKALTDNHIPFTTNPKRRHTIAQYNTIFPDSYFASVRSRRQGKKVVYYGHSTMEDFRNSFIGSNLVAPLFKKWITHCYSQGDVIITPSEYAKELLLSYGIKRPIHVLSNGIDLDFFKKSDEASARFRAAFGFTKDQKVIVSAGHYVDRKGLVEFIDLAHQLPQYTFLWCGYTNLNLVPAHIRTAIQQAPKNLVLPGYVQKEQLRDAYSGSDLFLFLTHEETEGIVLLEALSTKLPVLVRDIPLYKSWLPEGEVVYKARTQAEFKQNIIDMLEGQLPDLTEAGYKVAEERSLATIGKRLKEIYASISK